MRKPVLLLALIVCAGNSAPAQDDPKPAAALPSATYRRGILPCSAYRIPHGIRCMSDGQRTRS
jgi:hypothetical protein